MTQTIYNVQNSALKSQPQLDDARLDRNIHLAPGNGDVLATVSTLSVTAVKFASGSTSRVLSSNYHTPDKCKLSHFHNSYRYEINEKIIACIIASNNPYLLMNVIFERLLLY